MSLRGRITLIIITCFVALAAVLVLQGQRREAAAERRLEAAQLLILQVSWAGLSGAERQRLLGHLERFRRSPEAAASFFSGDRAGLDLATLALRGDLRTTHFQALRLDGAAIYDSRGPDPRPPVLTPAQVAAVAERTEPLAGLMPLPGGGLAFGLAAPVLATSGVVGVAVLWGDVGRLLGEMSAAIGMQSLILDAGGGLRAEGGGTEAALTAAILAAPPAADRMTLLRQGARVLRLASVSQDGLFPGPSLRLLALEDVSAELAVRARLRATALAALASTMVLFFAFVNWSLRTAFRPLNAVIQSLDGLSAGRTDLQVTVPARRDEIGRLAGTFETFRQGMEARERLERLTRELEVAARIQAQCLPRAFPQEPGLGFAAAMLPMREVGGDFYDIFRLPDGRIGLVVADVSDKGMGAALFMAVTRTVLRATAMSTPDPGDCVTRVNAYLCQDNEALLFVTLLYAVLDPQTGQIEQCNAGHNPAAVIDPSGAVRLAEGAGQPALGVWDDFVYASSTLALTPGSRLFLYTDGVTEAMTARGAEFGEARLIDALAEVAAPATDPGDARGRGGQGRGGERRGGEGAADSGAADCGAAAGAGRMVAHVLGAVDAFVDGAARSDDITCLALVRQPGPDHAG